MFLFAFTSVDIIFHKISQFFVNIIWKKNFRHEFSFFNRFTQLLPARPSPKAPKSAKRDKAFFDAP